MTVMNQVSYMLAIFSAAFVDIIFLVGFEAKEYAHVLKVLHLGAFAFAFGLNVWNMFFAGKYCQRQFQVSKLCPTYMLWPSHNFKHDGICTCLLCI